MGFLDDRDLVDALSEFLGVPVSNLRRENIEADAIALIPEDVAREQHAVPIRLGDAGLDVAAAEPSEELRDLLAKTRGPPGPHHDRPAQRHPWAIDSNYRAIGGVDNLIAAFVSVEGSRKRGPATPPRRHRPHVRRRAGRPGRRPHPHPGHPRPRLGRAHRARRRRRSHPLPHRRRAEGGAVASRRHGPRARQPHQDHGGDEHRRATPPPGRPAHDRRSTVQDVDVRVATVATISGESCVMRILDKTTLGLPPRRSRHAGRHPRDVLEDRPRSLRDGALRRTDGERQDHNALRHPQRGQQPHAQRHDH